jgi:hypothetical protein
MFYNFLGTVFVFLTCAPLVLTAPDHGVVVALATDAPPVLTASFFVTIPILCFQTFVIVYHTLLAATAQTAIEYTYKAQVRFLIVVRVCV